VELGDARFFVVNMPAIARQAADRTDV